MNFQLQNFLLYKKSLNDCSLGKQLILFPSGPVRKCLLNTSSAPNRSRTYDPLAPVAQNVDNNNPWTALLVSLILICRILIYLVGSAIQHLQNRTLVGAKASKLQSQTKNLETLWKILLPFINPPPSPPLLQCCCRWKGSCIGVSRTFGEDCRFRRQTFCTLPVKEI